MNASRPTPRNTITGSSDVYGIQARSAGSVGGSLKKLALIASVSFLAASAWIFYLGTRGKFLGIDVVESSSPKDPSPVSDSHIPEAQPSPPLQESPTITVFDRRDLLNAMTNCDTEAGKQDDVLYFMVTPVIPASFQSATELLPSGDNKGAYFFIGSRAALNGIQNGSLAISTQPYRFHVTDVATSIRETWASPGGVSMFKQSVAKSVSKFKVGFSLDGKNVESDEYDRRPRTCYWVNLRVPGLYAPAYGKSDGPSPNFPKPAAILTCANSVCERL